MGDTHIIGKSLLPLFKGGKIPPRNLYFFRSYEDQYAAVVNGDLKLTKYHSGKYELFNVRKDISEKKNLIDVNTHKSNQLKADLSKW